MKTIVLGLIFLLMFAAGSRADIHVVRPDGQGTIPDIQTAVDQSVDGDEIWLMAGVFTGPGNRDIAIGPRNILIKSFDGDPAACIIDCQGSPGDPHRAFVSASEDCQWTIIVGITMRGGYSTEGLGGGAMSIIGHSSVWVTNCVFEDNATAMTEWHGGGAVYANRSSLPVFNGCVFRNNRAFAGGAVNINHGGRVTFNGCRFIGNEAIRGGAVYGITTEKVGCLFANNEAETGGAIWHNSAGLDYYESCTFDGNRAADGGALRAVANYGGTVEMIDTIISNSPEGAAISIAGEVPITLSCSNLYGNAGGDWIEPFAAQVDERGNFSANPCYCDPDGGDWQLSADSFARPGGHPWGCDQLVGAYGVGCGTVGCSGPVVTEAINFGTLKSMYR